MKLLIVGIFMSSGGFCCPDESQRENKRKWNDRELKNLWNMRVMVIPIVVGALGTAPKSLEKSLEEWEIIGRIETSQTTALLRLARILRRVLETWEDLLSLKLQWKITSWHWCKKKFIRTTTTIIIIIYIKSGLFCQDQPLYFAQRLFSGLSSIHAGRSMLNGRLSVGKLHCWHLWHFWIALDLAF